MKTKLILSLMVAGFPCLAGSNDPPPKLWYQMQEAVLRTQDIHAVQALLDQGVDVNAPIGCGTYNPLDGAVNTANVEMVKFLLAHGAKPRARDIGQAAFTAESQQALEMVKALLQAGADPNGSTDNSGIPPLIGAAYRDHADVVALLLSQRGIKINKMEDDGETALMCAAEHGYSDIVDLLLHADADPTIKNKQGETAASVTEEAIRNLRAIISKLNSETKNAG